MAERRFELAASTTRARTLHARRLGAIADQLDWSSLDPLRYPMPLRELARLGWTENAFNEFCTAAAMGQLVAALAEAKVPIDLLALASTFAEHEILHVELCARVAMQLGGGAPIVYDDDALTVAIDRQRCAIERANELVVRLCCVGEAVSMPLLSGCLSSAAHPLTRAVLEQIVKDEALHAQFGWYYLDWITPRLDRAERDRLARAAVEMIAQLSPLWERLRGGVIDGVTAQGFRIEHVHELGWMEAEAYQSLARETLEARVLGPLARYGIKP